MKSVLQGLLLVLAATLLLQGCTGTGGGERADVEAPVEERAVSGDGSIQDGQADSGAQATGVEMGSPFEGRAVTEVLNDPESPVSKRVFYFGFDSSDLLPEDREALNAHAEFLLAHPELTVMVEGHADERGTREYNLALGERRSQTVERMLSLLGVAGNQLEVISFGEERPVALEHNEEAWRLNRRVELLYSGY